MTPTVRRLSTLAAQFPWPSARAAVNAAAAGMVRLPGRSISTTPPARATVGPCSGAGPAPARSGARAVPLAHAAVGGGGGGGAAAADFEVLIVGGGHAGCEAVSWISWISRIPTRTTAICGVPFTRVRVSYGFGCRAPGRGGKIVASLPLPRLTLRGSRAVANKSSVQSPPLSLAGRLK